MLSNQLEALIMADDTKISRHENPDIIKVEFVGAEDAVTVSMRDKGVSDLSDEQAIGRAHKVMLEIVGGRSDTQVGPTIGTDQTLAQS